MLGDDVPWNIDTLMRGQSPLIDALLVDLLTSYANNTLRQRDVLLKDVKLAEKEKESLRGLPLFARELFPVDFQALAQRLESDQSRINTDLLISTLAQQNVAAKAASKPPPSQPASAGRGRGGGGTKAA
eukprot:GHVU01170100.1.p1 GENE.GHVU01170100.1~~GHVU01170100.1.p1  ORF type:complete len:129 (+),score=9.67 GHVU01170100.1:258-644(+)